MKSLFLSLVALVLFAPSVHSAAPRSVAADDPNIAYIGRFDRSDPKQPVFMYSGCTIRTVFTGSSVEAVLRDEELKNFFAVIVDGRLSVLATNRPDGAYVLAQGLPSGRHTLEIIRRTEWHGGNTTFAGLRIDPDATLLPPQVSTRRIEFIGNSYTSGYGNEGTNRDEHFSYATENSYLSFGALTARALHAEALFVCRSGIGMVQSYDGNTEFNMPRLYDEVVQKREATAWDFSLFQPQLVVIDLSDNDYAKPLDRDAFINAYLRFLVRLRGHYPRAKIVCVVGPSPANETWQKWQADVRTVVNRRRETDPQVYYFGISNFELHGCDWHPNLDEHRKIAGELTTFLRDLMAW
jgi:Carbohydrate esterase 2 N-terminal/GDSL-like Lipase/Acylhydrolase family